jgi:serine/threonine protein kinase
MVSPHADDLASDPLLRELPVKEGYKVLGGVVIYHKLGQGGMGAVYTGRHLRLDIDVAVKVMVPPPNVTPEQATDFTQRFVREARTAAAVGHPNLIRVYDVNSESGVHYLIMDFVEGESAGERLERKGQLAEAEALKIALGAADGLAEAHAKGIVHRDVKPDNILIDGRGRVVVADLGLAKAFESDEADEPSMLTQTQTAMGTPCYMPPEQFASARSVGPEADVWSLGVTLYHLLTGQLPWSDSSVFGLAKKVEGDPLPDPKTIRPGLSEGTCAILATAMQKQKDARYKDCGAMAGALRRQLAEVENAGDVTLIDAAPKRPSSVKVTPPPARTLTLIAASELGTDEKTPAQEDSPPAVEAAGPKAATGTILIALLVILLLSGGGAGVYFLKQTWDTANLEQDRVAWRGLDDRVAAARQAGTPEAALKALDEFAASARTDEFDEQVDALRATLADEQKRADAAKRALEEKRTRCAAAVESARALTGAGKHAQALEELNAALDLVPGDEAAEQLLAEVKGKMAYTWEKEGRIKLDAHDEAVSGIDFSPDGFTVATGSADGTAILWNALDGTPVRVLRARMGQVAHVEFSPDGTKLVTAGTAKGIGLWDVATGTMRASLQGHEWMPRCATFSPNGKRLASVGAEKAIFIWDVDKGALYKKIELLQSSSFDADYSSDGTLLATSCFNGTIDLWNTTTYKKLRTLAGHERGSLWVRFSPDGATLASVSHDNTIVLWDPHTGEKKSPFPVKHVDGVTAVAFSPDGRLLVTGGYRGELIIWDVASATPLSQTKWYDSGIKCIAFSPNGRAIATGGDSSRALLALLPAEILATR